MEPSINQSNKSMIFVSKISLEVTESKLKEFFSLCGTIKSMFIRIAEDQKSKTAIIEYETPESVRMALMFNDTFIVDMSIKVIPYIFDIPVADDVNVTKPSQDIIINCLASAYIWGEKTWQTILNFDKTNKISQKIQQKAIAVDQKLKISEKTTSGLRKIYDYMTISEDSNPSSYTDQFLDRLIALEHKICQTCDGALKIGNDKLNSLRSEIQRRQTLNSSSIELSTIQPSDDTTQSLLNNSSVSEPPIEYMNDSSSEHTVDPFKNLFSQSSSQPSAPAFMEN